MDKKERFTQNSEGIKVTHVPQCNKCKHNINYHDCGKFSPKPEKFRANKEKCKFLSE